MALKVSFQSAPTLTSNCDFTGLKTLRVVKYGENVGRNQDLLSFNFTSTGGCTNIFSHFYITLISKLSIIQLKEKYLTILRSMHVWN